MVNVKYNAVAHTLVLWKKSRLACFRELYPALYRCDMSINAAPANITAWYKIKLTRPNWPFPLSTIFTKSQRSRMGIYGCTNSIYTLRSSFRSPVAGTVRAFFLARY
jgi:hypothetical protein